MNTKTKIAAVIAAGLLLGTFILRGHKPGEAAHGDDHDHGAETPAQAAATPASSASAADNATVAAPRTRFSDEQLRHNGVLLAAAGPARLQGQLQLLGEVALNQDRSLSLTARLAGRVEAVHANAGDRVQRGQLLAVISSPALADQRAELLAARKRLALAQATHDRERRLWEEKISAEQDYLAARQAWQEADIAVQAAQQKLAALGAGAAEGPQGLTRLEIRAPIAGVIVDRKITVGEVMPADAPAFQLADLSTVWVELAVPARELPRLHEGMTARVRATAFEAEGEARLGYVGALIGTQSRSATARLVLPNPRGLWRPGLPVTVALRAAPVDVPVAVPLEALQTLDDAPVAFVRQGQNFEARRVETGRSDDRQIEILKGLAAGERFAARNSFVVKADLGKAAAEHAH